MESDIVTSPVFYATSYIHTEISSCWPQGYIFGRYPPKEGEIVIYNIKRKKETLTEKGVEIEESVDWGREP